MKTTLKTFCFTALLGLVSTGRGATSDEPKSELAKLTGTWIHQAIGETKIIHFSEEKFASIFEFKDGTSTFQGTIAIDPAKTPKQMDFNFAAATGRGEGLKGTTSLSIYQLDGDTFKICVPRGHNGRPEAFPTGEGSVDGLYLVFKRVKATSSDEAHHLSFYRTFQ
jgi:uncharacterized protein (TIGR03067 family)